MRNPRKTFKGILLLLCLAIALLFSSLTTVYVYGESSQKEITTSEKPNSVLMHDDVYPGMDKIKNGDDWLYTYTVDGQIFSSEKSEDEAFLKAIF
jgi:hypothetical protein